MQGDDVASPQHLLERGIKRPHAGNVLVTGKQDTHAERFAEVGDSLAERAVADDAERRSREVADRIVEIAELSRTLPRAAGY